MAPERRPRRELPLSLTAWCALIALVGGILLVKASTVLASAGNLRTDSDNSWVAQATESATPFDTPSVTPSPSSSPQTPSVTPTNTPSSTPFATWTASPGPPPTVDPRVLTAPDAAAKDYFGYEVAIDGDRAAVATWDQAGSSTKKGVVYTFVRNGGTWAFEQKLTTEDEDEGNSGLGYSLALQGDLLVVGAPFSSVDGVRIGAAFVYRRVGGSWVREAKLSGDGGEYETFGWSVAADDDTIAVGAPREDSPEGPIAGAEAGAAYVFERQGGVWQRVVRLGENVAHASDVFGYDVAVGGRQMLISAPGDDTVGNAYGAVHVYELVNGIWIRQQLLVPYEGAPGNTPGFGMSVSFDADSGIVAVGAPLTDLNQGRVYIFQWNGQQWSGAASFGPFDGRDRYLGWSVAAHDTIVVAGAPGDDRYGENSGSAYAYVRAFDWHLRERWLLPDAEPQDMAGWSVATDGTTVILGVPGDDRGGWDTGSARVFSWAEGVPTVWPMPTVNDTVTPTPTQPAGTETPPTPTHVPTFGTPPSPTPTLEVFDGLYGESFEVSSFVAGGECPAYGAGDWLTANDEFAAAFASHFPYESSFPFAYTGRPLTVRARFLGSRAGPGQFGHLGQYAYQVTVNQLLLMETVSSCRYVDLTGGVTRPTFCQPSGKDLRVCIWNYGNQPVGPFDVTTDSGHSWRIGGLGAVEYRCLTPIEGAASTFHVDVDGEIPEDVESNNDVMIPTPDPSATAMQPCTPVPAVTPTVYGTTTPNPTSTSVVGPPPGTEVAPGPSSTPGASPSVEPRGSTVYLPLARQR